MTRTADRPTFACAECGAGLPKWVGRCPDCRTWGSVTESAATRPRPAGRRGTAPARPVTDVDAEAARYRPTGVAELDRVLGGGVVPGSVVLLAGEPGVGKSTLLLAVAGAWAAAGHRCLVVTGEESVAQVRLRADRIGAVHPNLYLAAEADLGAVLAHVDEVRPSLLVVDSVQTVASPLIDGAAGGVTQVREVAAAVSAVAKERGIATVLVGHVTKDGTVAGPKVLEHLVDVVLQFEGDRQSRLRLVRAAKNRYGAADEVGCFDLRDDGIVGLPDPSGLFLSRSPAPVAGTCVTVVSEGRRALLAEVQALVASSTLSVPRRATSGMDAARVAMVLAVLERRGRQAFGSRDVYVATVGGMRVTEPAADLAVALAVASAAADRPLPARLVAIGEVGLAGELRPVRGLGSRLAEAARLGFDLAVVPAGGDPVDSPIEVLAAETLQEALRLTTDGARTAAAHVF